MRRSVSTFRTYARTKHPVVSLLNVTGSILRDFLLEAKVLLVVIPRPIDGRDGAGVERLEPLLLATRRRYYLNALGPRISALRGQTSMRMKSALYC